MAAEEASIVKALLVAIVAAVFFTASSAQELAPAPSPATGAAFSLPVATAVVGASILVSLSALLRH